MVNEWCRVHACAKVQKSRISVLCCAVQCSCYIPATFSLWYHTCLYCTIWKMMIHERKMEGLHFKQNNSVRRSNTCEIGFLTKWDGVKISVGHVCKTGDNIDFEIVDLCCILFSSTWLLKEQIVVRNQGISVFEYWTLMWVGYILWVT